MYWYICTWSCSFSVCTLSSMMMMMTGMFCCIVDRKKAFNLIPRLDHCQRFSSLRNFNTPSTPFKPAQNLSSDVAELRCSVVITATPRCIELEIETGIELELPTDVDLVLMVEKRIRGGICHAIHRYAKANNK